MVESFCCRSLEESLLEPVLVPARRVPSMPNPGSGCECHLPTPLLKGRVPGGISCFRRRPTPRCECHFPTPAVEGSTVPGEPLRFRETCTVDGRAATVS